MTIHTGETKGKKFTNVIYVYRLLTFVYHKLVEVMIYIQPNLWTRFVNETWGINDLWIRIL